MRPGAFTPRDVLAAGLDRGHDRNTGVQGAADLTIKLWDDRREIDGAW
jgi:hypothetical protein